MAEKTLEERAHAIVNLMSPEQLTTLVPLIESMLPPFERSLANAPWDDEPVSDEEKSAIAASYKDIDENRTFTHAEVLAEYGLTEADLSRMNESSFMEKA